MIDIRDEKYLSNLKVLRESLPAGYTKRISQEMGVSAMTVTNALWGRTRRYDIVEKAIQIMNDYNKLARKLEKTVNE